MNLNACHANQFKAFSGCSVAVLALLESRLQVRMRNKRGPPYRHSLWPLLIVTLMKLRLQLSYRALSAFTGIGNVTLSRIVLRMCALLASLPLASASGCGFLIVDSTGCRVRSRQREDYSGYKHHQQFLATRLTQGLTVNMSFCSPRSSNECLYRQHPHEARRQIS